MLLAFRTKSGGKPPHSKARFARNVRFARSARYSNKAAAARGAGADTTRFLPRFFAS
jgi:hypothetical protein